MLRFGRLLALPLGIALGFWLTRAHAATYSVGSDGACNYTSIQDAIDAARDHEGVDFVDVARNATYEGVSLDIADHDLVLAGGFANCSQAVADGAYTELDGGDDTVIRIHGQGDVVILGFTITNGRAPRTDTGFGGGIAITGGPHLVNLANVIVNRNEAGRGGGISVRNTISGDPGAVQLVLSDNVTVSNNRAGYSAGRIEGGGVYCEESALVMNGGGITSIFSNEADHDGGGVGISECDVTIAPRGATNFNGIVLNTAGRDGGGLAINGASGGGTRIYTGAADRPVYIAGNIAGREGGGLKLDDNADVAAWDLILEDNRAADGGALSVHAGAGDLTRFTMRGDLTGAPATAVQCARALGCNRISGNVAEDGAGVRGQGSAFRAESSRGVLEEHAEYQVVIEGARIQGNDGINTIRTISNTYGDGSLELNGAVIAGNRADNELLFAERSLILRSVTLGANALAGPNVIRALNGGAVQVARSIIWQPGARTLLSNEGSVHDDYVVYNIASDFTDIPGSPTNVIADPLFVDTANGDVHLSVESPAIDYAPASNDPEADDATRVVDLDEIEDEFGTQDAGAYEVQQVPLDDTIFADGFDDTP